MSKVITRTWDSPDKFWDYCDKTPDGSHINQPRGITASFTDTRDFNEAKSLARKGWPEGLSEIKRISAKISEKLGSPILEYAPVYDVIGESPDIGAFLSGEPEHMIGFSLREGASKLVRIVVNIGASGGIDNGVIRRRGAIACALVDALESSGFRAEVIAAWNQFSSRECPRVRHEGKVVVKKPEEPLNMDRMAFMLAHPSFIRRFCFHALDLEDKETRILLGATGPLGFYAYARPLEKKDQGDIYIGEAFLTDTAWRDDVTAAKRVLEMVQACGVRAIEVSK